MQVILSTHIRRMCSRLEGLRLEIEKMLEM